uniref:Uncharacterized protein n=1 Tax=Cannabis sativa TaxID=3483 RepID=A0A803PBE9_CANSA
MNPGKFWGGTHHIEQDLLQFLYKNHPQLRADSSSTSESSLTSSFDDRKVSNDHSKSSEPAVQYHQYPDRISGEGYGRFIWELNEGWRCYLPASWTYRVRLGILIHCQRANQFLQPDTLP